MLSCRNKLLQCLHIIETTQYVHTLQDSSIVNIIKTKHSSSSQGITIRDRWRLEGEIGAGGFGQVYLGNLLPPKSASSQVPLIYLLDLLILSTYLATDLKTDKFVAVKLCCLIANSSNSSSLLHESTFYRMLKDQPGIAALHDIGFDHRQSIEFMVCDLLGTSLWALLGRCGHRFSLKTTLMLADQLISRVEMLHSKNLLHRDLKMENIVMGFGKENGKTAYILDFGLSGHFRPRGDYITAPDYSVAGTTDTACIAWHLSRVSIFLIYIPYAFSFHIRLSLTLFRMCV